MYEEVAESAVQLTPVTWHWEAVAPGGEALAVGLEFVILAADGRIATDYQFVD